MKFLSTNRIAPDWGSRSVVSHLVLSCLPMTHKKDARLNQIKDVYIYSMSHYVKHLQKTILCLIAFACHMSLHIRIPTIGIHEIKGLIHLCSNCTADQRLSFYNLEWIVHSLFSLSAKFQAFNYFLWLYGLV